MCISEKIWEKYTRNIRGIYNTQRRNKYDINPYTIYLKDTESIFFCYTSLQLLLKKMARTTRSNKSRNYKFTFLGEKRERAPRGDFTDERKLAALDAVMEFAPHELKGRKAKEAWEYIKKRVNEASGGNELTISGIRQYLARAALEGPKAEKKERATTGRPVPLSQAIIERELDYAEMVR